MGERARGGRGTDCACDTVRFFMQPRVFLIKCRIMNFTCERDRQTEGGGEGERKRSARPLKF